MCSSDLTECQSQGLGTLCGLFGFTRQAYNKRNVSDGFAEDDIKDGILYGSSLGDLTIEDYFQGELSYLLGATQKLPVDKARIKADHYTQDIRLDRVWSELKDQETSNSIISQFQDKTLLKLRISYNKDFLPTKIQGFYNSQKLNGWQDLFYIDYPYVNQAAFEQAQDVYIQNIQYLEAHPKEETGD